MTFCAKPGETVGTAWLSEYKAMVMQLKQSHEVDTP